MPERPTRPTPRATPSRPAARPPSVLPIYLTAALLFVAMTAFLGARVADGRDPALGGKKTAQVVLPKRVLVRKVIITKRITVIKPAPVQSTPGTVQASAPVQSGGGTSVSAPVYAPAPAPVYAPAPAPVQSATS
ncbi:MAG TPA: hypothetical protein VII98_11130 [Solirubrobacteraceae bacterium]